MQQAFARAGFQIVSFGKPADLFVVNTCTVTGKSDAETGKIVNKILHINPNAQIALVGCQAQTQKEKLLTLPGVHWVVGNAVKLELPALIKQHLNENLLLTPPVPQGSFTMPSAEADDRHTRANLKIQDGCDFYCSYCEIPYARGHARSREFDDIRKEAEILVRAGHKELILTGVNVGTYNDNGRSLADVVHRLEEIPGLLRIRISSFEATTFPVEILPFMAQEHKLCRFMHISLQSGCDKILQSMNRRYTTREYADFLLLAHRTVDNICLGTDVIVGFPGETDEDFEITRNYLQGLPFTYFHVFSYSDRPNSKSKNFPNKVTQAKIRERSQILRELSRQKRAVYLQNQIGRVEKVLFEQKKNGLWSGVTDTFIKVKVESVNNLHNQYLPVRLDSVCDQTMQGTLTME